MLRKLMKHEFRATSRIMLPILLLVLVTAVGGNLSIRRLLDAGNGFAATLGVLLLTAFVLAIMAVCIVSFVLMIRRFYQNLLRDEGYLMMTLPASVHKLILSKTLVSVIWFAVTAAVVALSLLILVANMDFVRNIVRGFDELMAALLKNGPDLSGQTRAMLAAIGLWTPLLMVIGTMYMCLQCYAAMAIGHSFSSHKGVLSVAAYIAIQVAQSLAASGLSWLLVRSGLADVFVRMMEGAGYGARMNLVLLGVAVLDALLVVLMHMVTAYFLKNRLNLE